MKHRARFSLNSLVQGLLNYYELAPSQLNPNVYKLMAGMHVLRFQPKFEDLSPEEFCHMYRLASQKTSPGYFFMRPWQKNQALMENLSSSCDGWKDKNFWLGENFGPLSSVGGRVGVLRNYRAHGKFST